MEAWTDFGVAVTGASAALTGLVFVALSINLRQIVSSQGLPGRALQALLLLAVPLVAGTLLVVPQEPRPFGAQLLAVAAVFGPVLCFLARPDARSPEQPRAAWLIVTALPVAAVTVAVLGAGVLLTAGRDDGLYLLPVAVVAGFFGALTSTWVLLVEIVR